MIYYKGPDVIEPIPETIIHEQIQRIFRSPQFIVSEVFRNFLKYIVTETLSGRSDDIKEYNIAIQVLKKPAGFDISKSGIVRVHAARLRAALDNYYAESTANEACIIAMPKGRYVPVFTLIKNRNAGVVRELLPDKQPCENDQVKLAVLPFNTFENDISRMTFTDGIGLGLTSELAMVNVFSLVSYFTCQHIKEKQLGIDHLASKYGTQYVVTGCVQFEFPRVKVCFQIIRADSEIQLHSETYYYDNFKSDNMFELEEVVITNITRSVKSFTKCAARESRKNISHFKFKNLAQDTGSQIFNDRMIKGR